MTGGVEINIIAIRTFKVTLKICVDTFLLRNLVLIRLLPVNTSIVS